MGVAAAVGATDVVRVMVVDDSVVARSLMSRWLQEQAGFEVVAACKSGREAVEHIGWARPDVAVLDVEMPGMDGVEALPLLLRARPGLAVLMNSSFTTRGAELSLRCLALGATDVLAKPSREASHSDEYRIELVAKVRALGDVARRRSAAASRVSIGAAALANFTASRSRFAAAEAARPDVRAIVIGASTGGPQAVAEVLGSLGQAVERVPVLVAQHMPRAFTTAFAEHLALGSGLKVREAANGEEIAPGRVYLAPGGMHFAVARQGDKTVARVFDGAPVNFCKPSVDPLFRSAAEVYGSGLVAVVLTGMGADGASAISAISASGGRTFAQDEATSVVWGMPGAAAATGLCAGILPLKEIGPRLSRMVIRGRP